MKFFLGSTFHALPYKYDMANSLTGTLPKGCSKPIMQVNHFTQKTTIGISQNIMLPPAVNISGQGRKCLQFIPWWQHQHHCKRKRYLIEHYRKVEFFERKHTCWISRWPTSTLQLAWTNARLNSSLPNSRYQRIQRTVTVSWLFTYRDGHMCCKANVACHHRKYTVLRTTPQVTQRWQHPTSLATTESDIPLWTEQYQGDSPRNTLLGNRPLQLPLRLAGSNARLEAILSASKATMIKGTVLFCSQ